MGSNPTLSAIYFNQLEAVSERPKLPLSLSVGSPMVPSNGFYAFFRLNSTTLRAQMLSTASRSLLGIPCA